MEYKKLHIVRDAKSTMYKIEQPGSGALPSAFKGEFTSIRFAKAAIDGYQPKRGAKSYVSTEGTSEL